MPKEMIWPIRSDALERLLGKTHRCQECWKAFEQSRQGPNRCPVCSGRNIKALEGLELIKSDYYPLSNKEELTLGRTHRCVNCGLDFALTKKNVSVCPECGSKNLNLLTEKKSANPDYND